jgi:hypothetical protein
MGLWDCVQVKPQGISQPSSLTPFPLSETGDGFFDSLCLRYGTQPETQKTARLREAKRGSQITSRPSKKHRNHLLAYVNRGQRQERRRSGTTPCIESKLIATSRS